MTFQKLSYSNTKCNNYIYFALDADYFDVDEVTAELKIKPTSVMIKSNPVPKSTSWKYEIVAGTQIDLETFLHKLVDVFEPKIEEIRNIKTRLKLESRIQFVIDIDINPDSSTPYFGMNHRIISFLNLTDTEVDFDLYKSDTIGLLKSNE